MLLPGREKVWAYLAVIIDLFSRRVVGWAMSEANDTRLALDVLAAATRSRRLAAGLVHHSDRGACAPARTPSGG